MPEDAGKKRYIRSFLQQVKSGTGFIEDIRIERIIRKPGSDGEGSTARSSSGRQITKITELLEDDIKHTFDDGFFTFRFVAALVGSGKTSLLTYLHELIKTQDKFLVHSIVVQFQISDIGLGSNFGDRFYCYILADTFYHLLHNENLYNPVRDIAEKILSDFLENNQIAQLRTTNKLIVFRTIFRKYITTESVGVFEHFFFHVISKVTQVDPGFNFIYLADELDSIAGFSQEIQETRLVLKQLIRRAFTDFDSKIRILMYIVGTSDNVGSFILEDAVIQSLVGDWIINLYKGYSNEFEQIREKIENRIKGAYSGYKNFDKAWQEIKSISINPSNTLREFCRNYGSAILEIHEKYFQEAPEQVFEGDARNLVKAECRKYWASFLNKAAYTLSSVSTTTVIEGHAFDCHVELKHNGKTVARAFGEAKNYEVLSSHFDTFTQWLNDVKFNPSNSAGMPTDLAFMIAPCCPPLLQRKLELSNIHFIKSDKIVPISIKTPTNINTATKAELIDAFKGTGIKSATVDKIIARRNDQSMKPYKDLDSMVSDLKFTANVRKKLQDKINKEEMRF